MFRVEIDRIIERQMRNWELARTQTEAPAKPPESRVYEFIAISRQKGSGGLDLARRLGDELGWRVYDHEIIDLMAADDALQHKIYQLADEDSEGYLQTLLRGLDLEPQTPRHDYFRKLVRSIQLMARSAPGIFVGRGAHLILPRRAGLSVRVLAPESRRIAEYARTSACSLDEAANAVRRIDEARDRFIRDHFRVNPQAPHLFDLVLNLEHLSLPAAVRIILAALQDKTGYRREAPARIPEAAVEYSVP